MFAFKKFNHSVANTPTPGQWLMIVQCPYSDYSKYYLYSTVVLASKCYLVFLLWSSMLEEFCLTLVKIVNRIIKLCSVSLFWKGNCQLLNLWTVNMVYFGEYTVNMVCFGEYTVTMVYFGEYTAENKMCTLLYVLYKSRTKQVLAEAL